MKKNSTTGRPPEQKNGPKGSHSSLPAQSRVQFGSAASSLSPFSSGMHSAIRVATPSSLSHSSLVSTTSSSGVPLRSSPLVLPRDAKRAPAEIKGQRLTAQSALTLVVPPALGNGYQTISPHDDGTLGVDLLSNFIEERDIKSSSRRLGHTETSLEIVAEHKDLHDLISKSLGISASFGDMFKFGLDHTYQSEIIIHNYIINVVFTLIQIDRIEEININNLFDDPRYQQKYRAKIQGFDKYKFYHAYGDHVVQRIIYGKSLTAICSAEFSSFEEVTKAKTTITTALQYNQAKANLAMGNDSLFKTLETTYKMKTRFVLEADLHQVLEQESLAGYITLLNKSEPTVLGWEMVAYDAVLNQLGNPLTQSIKDDVQTLHAHFLTTTQQWVNQLSSMSNSMHAYQQDIDAIVSGIDAELVGDSKNFFDSQVNQFQEVSRNLLNDLIAFDHEIEQCLLHPEQDLSVMRDKLDHEMSSLEQRKNNLYMQFVQLETAYKAFKNPLTIQVIDETTHRDYAGRVSNDFSYNVPAETAALYWVVLESSLGNTNINFRVRKDVSGKKDHNIYEINGAGLVPVSKETSKVFFEIDGSARRARKITICAYAISPSKMHKILDNRSMPLAQAVLAAMPLQKNLLSLTTSLSASPALSRSPAATISTSTLLPSRIAVKTPKLDAVPAKHLPLAQASVVSKAEHQDIEDAKGEMDQLDHHEMLAFGAQSHFSEEHHEAEDEPIDFPSAVSEPHEGDLPEPTTGMMTARQHRLLAQQEIKPSVSMPSTASLSASHASLFSRSSLSSSSSSAAADSSFRKAPAQSRVLRTATPVLASARLTGASKPKGSEFTPSGGLQFS